MWLLEIEINHLNHILLVCFVTLEILVMHKTGNSKEIHFIVRILGFTVYSFTTPTYTRTQDGSMVVAKFAWLGEFHFITNINVVNFGTDSLCATLKQHYMGCHHCGLRKCSLG